MSATSWIWIFFGLLRLSELLPRQYLLIDCVAFMKRAGRLKRNNTSFSLLFLIAHAVCHTIQLATHHAVMPLSCGGASISGALNLLPVVDSAGSIFLFLVLLTVALLWLELAEAALKMQSVKVRAPVTHHHHLIACALVSSPWDRSHSRTTSDPPPSSHALKTPRVLSNPLRAVGRR